MPTSKFVYYFPAEVPQVRHTIPILGYCGNPEYEQPVPDCRLQPKTVADFPYDEEFGDVVSDIEKQYGEDFGEVGIVFRILAGYHYITITFKPSSK